MKIPPCCSCLYNLDSEISWGRGTIDNSHFNAIFSLVSKFVASRTIMVSISLLYLLQKILFLILTQFYIFHLLVVHYLTKIDISLYYIKSTPFMSGFFCCLTQIFWFNYTWTLSPNRRMVFHRIFYWLRNNYIFTIKWVIKNKLFKKT